MTRIIDIIIPHYGDPKTTHRCIASLGFHRDCRIIIYDNSFNMTPKKCSMQKFRIPAVKNIGFGAACNRGAKYGNSKYIMFINNDVVVRPGFLKYMFSIMDSRWDIDFLCPAVESEDDGRTIYAGGSIDFSGARHHLFPRPGVFKTGLLYGCCIMARREAFRVCGMFDESHFLYYEDLQLSMEAARRGMGMFCAGDVAIIHGRNIRGTENADFSPEVRYYQARNLPYVFQRYFAPRRLIAFYTYYLAWFIPIRVFYSLLCGKIKTVAFILRGVWDYFNGRRGEA